jgi:hypothetical protein
MLFTGFAILACSALGFFQIGAPAVHAAPQRKTNQRPPVTAGADSTTPTSTDMQALQKLAAEADLKYVDLKAQLDYNSKNAENLGRLLAFLTFFTSLFVIALGVNSYFGFKQLLQGAKDDLNLAHKAIGDMRDEIYAAYPLLNNVDAALRGLLITLHSLLPVDVNWRDFTLKEADRQRYLNAELKVAWLEVFRLDQFPQYRRSASEIYQGLALFYGNQAVKVAPGSLVNADGPEIRRALLYIDKACQTDDRNASAFSDYGALHSVRQDFESAKTKFGESLGVDEGEPGALFGLAFILAKGIPPDTPADLAGAIERMDTLIRKRQWAPGQQKKYLAEAYLNRACYRARRAEIAPAADQNACYEAAMQDLEKGSVAFKTHGAPDGWQERVKGETEKDKDLAGLYAQAGFKARIDRLIS